MSLVSVVCCQVVFSASGWSFLKRYPTECGVCEWSCSLNDEETLAQ